MVVGLLLCDMPQELSMAVAMTAKSNFFIPKKSILYVLASLPRDYCAEQRLSYLSKNAIYLYVLWCPVLFTPPFCALRTVRTCLPFCDLASYKWAFLASLHGHKKAEQMALTLEQLLSTDDIDLATKSIQSMLPGLTEQKTATLALLESELESKKAELEEINQEIDGMLGIKFVPPEGIKEVPEAVIDEKMRKKHFSEEDRM